MQAVTLPPLSRGELSPVSTAGSEWSGVNAYNQIPRNDAPLNTYSLPKDDFGPSKALPALRSPPINGPPGFGGQGQLEPLGQRRPSDSGSRGSSRAASIANSRSSDGTISDQQSRKYKKMEIELFQHYTVLKGYLRGGSQVPPRPNKARDKLLRLSPVQFHELSTDVFDELQRRQAAAPIPGRPPRQMNVPNFLQPRSDFHEKRNQARQKLSSLQVPRFKDLSTDVFCELERRFPQFASRPDTGNRPGSRSRSRGPGSVSSNNGLPAFPAPQRAQTFGPSGSQGFQRQDSVSSLPQFENPLPPTEFGRPMAKQFQSNTITPNKSTMVEDEDETQASDSRYDRSSDAFGLESSLTSPRSDRDTSATSQSGASIPYNSKANQANMIELQDKMAQLESTVEMKDQQIRQMEMEKTEWETAKENVEKKLEEAQNLNKSLQQEIDKLKAETPHYSGENVLWKTKYLKLDHDHSIMQEQLDKQRSLTEEVSRQGQLYLQEMRDMAESGTGSSEREEKLQEQVHKLEEEVKEWKGRYVKTKTQLRSVRASSIGLTISRADAARHGAALQDQDGLVKDVHVTKFQIAIDELLRIARSETPAAVLDHMKVVVLAVRGITSDIDAAPLSDKDDEVSKRRTKMKSKISATANNLITASKNFASAQGLSPISLVDAAASHLTAAVVDLLHTVKIRPTPAGELEDDDEPSLEPLQSNGYFNVVESLRRRSAVESVYSALSTPSETRTGSNQASSGLYQRGGSAYINGAGLGIKSAAGYGTSQEEADLEDLKVSVSRIMMGLATNNQIRCILRIRQMG